MMNHNFNLLVFLSICTIFSKNFSSASAHTHDSQPLTKKTNSFSKKHNTLAEVLETSLILLDKSVREYNERIVDLLSEKELLVSSQIQAMNILLETCSQDTTSLQEQLKALTDKEEESFTPITRRHMAIITQLHQLQEKLESKKT